MAATESKTDEQLIHEADRLMAEHQKILAERERREDERRKSLSEAQRAWRQGVVDKAPTIEATLEKEGREHYDKALSALEKGDLVGAYGEWQQYATAHRVKSRVRQEAVNSAAALGVAPHAHGTLSGDRGKFVDFLASNDERALEGPTEDRLQALIGEIPLN